jgi:SET and MYND domain-containing protein
MFDDEFRSIGVGIYPTLSLINHDCSPNCIALFDGKKVTIRAISDIKKGDEVDFFKKLIHALDYNQLH